MILPIAVFITVSVAGQSNLAPTDTVRISGKIKKEIFLTLSTFDTLKKTSIGDLTMLDRNGDVKENKRIESLDKIVVEQVI